MFSSFINRMNYGYISTNRYSICVCLLFKFVFSRCSSGAANDLKPPADAFCSTPKTLTVNIRQGYGDICRYTRKTRHDNELVCWTRQK